MRTRILIGAAVVLLVGVGTRFLWPKPEVSARVVSWRQSGKACRVEFELANHTELEVETTARLRVYVELPGDAARTRTTRLHVTEQFVEAKLSAKEHRMVTANVALPIAGPVRTVHVNAMKASRTTHSTSEL